MSDRLVTARRFWPGFSWRILAWMRDGGEAQATEGSYTGARCEVYAGEWAEQAKDRAGAVLLEGDWELDEVVIDHWFHLEQMSDRDWWIGIGDHAEGSDYVAVYVTVDARKRVRVLTVGRES